MKNRFKRIYGISLKVLLSYLFILLIPLMAVSVIYYTSSQTLILYEQQKNQNRLEEIAKEISIRMSELNNITLYVKNNPTINSVINHSQIGADQQYLFPVYQVISTFPQYSTFNQFIDNVFIFFNDSQYTIKLPNAYFTTSNTYYSHANFAGVSYEDLMELSNQKQENRLLVCSDSQKNDILLLQSIPDSLRPKGLIVLQINKNAIRDTLSLNDYGDAGATYLMDSGGALVAHVGNREFSADELLYYIDSPLQRQTITKNGISYLITVHKDSRFSYVSLLKESYLLEQIAPIRYVMSALAVSSCFMGVVACIVLWRRRSHIVNQLSSAAQRLGVEKSTAKNERALVEQTLKSYDSAMSQLEKIIDSQRENLQDTALNNLLIGKLSGAENIKKELEAFNIETDGYFFHVLLVVLPHSVAQSANQTQALPYRVFLRKFFNEHLPIKHLICNIDNSSLAVILLDKDNIGQEKLRDVLSQFILQIEADDWVAPSFSVAGGCDDISLLHHRYKTAESIRLYMECLALQGIFFASDLPCGEDSIHFPVSAEMRLVQIIKTGTPEELEGFWKQAVINENLELKNLSWDKIPELRSTLRFTLLRSLEEASSGKEMQGVLQSIRVCNSIPALYKCACRAQDCLSGMVEKQHLQEQDSIRLQLEKLIKENLSDPAFNLSMLAEMAKQPEKILYRDFKGYFGMSFANYLEQYRIQMAVDLLYAQTPVKDVSELVGYSSDQTFRRAFKRVMKVPPSQFSI